MEEKEDVMYRRKQHFKGLCNYVIDMIVKMKPRGEEYPKTFNTGETGKMS
jgi:hypothetical protein